MTTPLLPTSTLTLTQTRKRSGASTSLAMAADNAEKLLLRPVVEASAPNITSTNNVMTFSSNGNGSNAATTGQMVPDTERTYY